MVKRTESDTGFEDIYASAGGDLASIPWASMAAHPALDVFLGVDQPGIGQRALVIGCGLGDDAEALSSHGYEVRAFDIAPSAIAACRRRFPGSTVDYQVADLFALPKTWRHRFDLVVESRTLQSLPLAERGSATRAIAETVRAGGQLWVRCLAREEAEAVGSRPWPVSRSELDSSVDAGLREQDFHEEPGTDGRGPSFTVVYQRQHRKRSR